MKIKKIKFYFIPNSRINFCLKYNNKRMPKFDFK